MCLLLTMRAAFPLRGGRRLRWVILTTASASSAGRLTRLVLQRFPGTSSPFLPILFLPSSPSTLPFLPACEALRLTQWPPPLPKSLSQEVASYLGMDLSGITIKRFADGEIYVQVQVGFQPTYCRTPMGFILRRA